MSAFKDIWRNAKNFKFLAYFIVVLYSSVRALLASTVDEFQGSIVLLWLIDVGTVIPYLWGVTKMFTGDTARQKILGVLVGVPSFLAPYIYWYNQGEDYPVFVNVVVVVFIIAAIVVEAAKRRKKKTKKINIK